jgi:small-conductance mechanosensitive channel
VDESFWQQHGDLISALITMAVAIVIAFIVDRLVMSRAGRVAGRVTEVRVSRAAQTRLRLIRRLVFVAILLIGAALALSNFAKIQRLATGILASSAVLGLVIGFAARQTIANMVSGILIAITQPIRIGDTVTIEGETGRVDDLTLSYTYIDPGDGRLVVVPNEKVTSGVLFNHSTGDRAAPATVSVWVPPDADLDEARRVLKPAGAAEVSIAEMADRAQGPARPRAHPGRRRGGRAPGERSRGAAGGRPSGGPPRPLADRGQLPFPGTSNDSAST